MNINILCFKGKKKEPFVITDLVYNNNNFTRSVTIYDVCKIKRVAIL